MPGTERARLQRAIDAHRAGRVRSAELGYLRHLRRFPDDPSALHFLGLLRTQQGRTEEGLALMRRALQADPGYVDAWANLGLALFAAKQLEEAERCHRKATELAPTFTNAWANLAACLRARGRHDEAVACLRRVVELEPRNARAYESLGRLLYRLRRESEAAETYRRWAELDPDDPVARHMAVASGGVETPARASDAYVERLFDDFADGFDESLASLGYQAPQLVIRQAQESLGPAFANLAVLDLGCGTGLCGPLLRPAARRLVGVDLSANMLAQAARRAVYDELVRAELTQYLAGCAHAFDLLIAADVLCYFGELDAALRGMRRVLAPDGLAVFTLEKLPPEQTGHAFLLQSHGRYAHSPEYVTEVIAASGLQCSSLVEDMLRFERHEPVIGMVVAARRAKAG